MSLAYLAKGPITARETDRLLRSWGFQFVNAGRDHKAFKSPGGKTTIIPKKGNLNVHQIAEICNLLKVSEEEFRQGPPPPSLVVKPTPEPAPPPEPAPQPPEPTEAESKEDTVPIPRPTPFERERHLTQPRMKVIAFLKEKGGSVRDPSGRATSQMALPLGYSSSVVLSSLLRVMEEDGQIIRDIKGKRTFEILLLPEGPGVSHVSPVRIVEPAREPEPVLEPEPTAERELTAEPESPPEPEPETAEEAPPDWEKVDYAELAAALLDHTISVINRQDVVLWEQRYNEVAVRLGESQEHAERLRARVRKLEDEVTELNARLRRVQRNFSGDDFKVFDRASTARQTRK